MTSDDIRLVLATFWKWLIPAIGIAIPSTAAAYALFKYAGQKWVERLLSRDLEQFKREQQEKLEGFKGEQQKELERLRHLLSTRVSKIHEKEFEVLPAIWLLLNDLNGAVHRAVDLTFKPYPDFRSFSDAQLEGFLLSEPIASMFSEYQKNELRKATDKDTYYMEALMSKYISEAENKHRIFLNYLIEHRIFMTDDLRARLEDARKALFGALTSYSIGKSANDWEMMRHGQDDMLKNMQTRINEVEQAIQKRLCSGSAGNGEAFPH